MAAWQVFVILIGIIGLLVLIAIIAKRRRKKRPLKKIRSHIDHGNYIAAGRLYLDQKQQQDAADLYFKMPPEHRPAYEAMILQKLGKKGAQLFWIRAGRRYERTNTHHARKAYLLAGAYYDCIKMFIDQGERRRAIEVVGQIPPNLQEDIVRRLAQYAFDRGKFHISAELLRSLGFVGEADAILAVAAHEFGAIERPQAAADLYDAVGRQDLAGESHEEDGEKALAEGRIEEAKTAFKSAIEAYDASNQPKDALRVEERLKKFDRLDSFRVLAAEGRATEAEEMIEEISNHFPRISISDLYAEIASVLEKRGNLDEAITYFDKAADATKNPVKRQSYVNALRRLGSEIASKTDEGTQIAIKDLKERCIVCKLPIKAGRKYILCPHCKKPAHYSHLVEWIKVQGTCPVCHKKIRLDQIKNE